MQKLHEVIFGPHTKFPIVWIFIEITKFWSWKFAEQQYI